MVDEAADGNARALAATLAAAERGDVAATAELFAALYRELHRLARRQLHANASGLTLGATTLLHEAYLDLSQPRRGVPRPRALLRLCRARDARPDHRLRARAPRASSAAASSS